MSAHDRDCFVPCEEQLAGFDCPCIERVQAEAREAERELVRQSEAIRAGAEARAREKRERPS